MTVITLPISCAWAFLSPVRFFIPRYSLVDCKLNIRTRLLASAFSNFWKLVQWLLFVINVAGCFERVFWTETESLCIICFVFLGELDIAPLPKANASRWKQGVNIHWPSSSDCVAGIKLSWTLSLKVPKERSYDSKWLVNSKGLLK